MKLNCRKLSIALVSLLWSYSSFADTRVLGQCAYQGRLEHEFILPGIPAKIEAEHFEPCMNSKLEHWDQLCIILPNTAKEKVDVITGVDVKLLKDNETVLLLLHEGQAVYHYFHRWNFSDFSAVGQQCYAREEIKFKTVMEGNFVRVKPAD